MAAKAIILFGHGSRDPLWRQPIEAVAARLARAQPDVPVACAYLELDTPDLATAAAQLRAGGASAITIVPMFLGVGRHVREDLPRLVDSLGRTHPEITLILQPPVGEDARLLDLLVKIAMA